MPTSLFWQREANLIRLLSSTYVKYAQSILEVEENCEHIFRPFSRSISTGNSFAKWPTKRMSDTIMLMSLLLYIVNKSSSAQDDCYCQARVTRIDSTASECVIHFCHLPLMYTLVRHMKTLCASATLHACPPPPPTARLENFFPVQSYSWEIALSFTPDSGLTTKFGCTLAVTSTSDTQQKARNHFNVAPRVPDPCTGRSSAGQGRQLGWWQVRRFTRWGWKPA